jgi:hypothetical protein
MANVGVVFTFGAAIIRQDRIYLQVLSLKIRSSQYFGCKASNTGMYLF